MQRQSLDDGTLQRLYAWIDEIPLSRPKKNITRDFSDGILLAEVIAYYFPKMVQMHNYSPANSATQKQYNWTTLNRKVLKKLHLVLSKDDINDLVVCRAGAVEQLLVKLQLKIANYKEQRPTSSHRSESLRDQHECEQLPPSPSTITSAASFGNGACTTRTNAYPLANDKQAELREPQFQPYESSAQEPMYDRSSADYAMAPTTMGAIHASNSASDMIVQGLQAEVAEKDQTISDMKETMQILEMKIQKLEQLIRLKDGKIQTLVAKLRSQKPQ